MTDNLGYSALAASLATGAVWAVVTVGRIVCARLVGVTYTVRTIVSFLTVLCAAGVLLRKMQAGPSSALKPISLLLPQVRRLFPSRLRNSACRRIAVVLLQRRIWRLKVSTTFLWAVIAKPALQPWCALLVRARWRHATSMSSWAITIS